MQPESTAQQLCESEFVIIAGGLSQHGRLSNPGRRIVKEKMLVSIELDKTIVKAKSRLTIDNLIDEMKDVLSKAWGMQSRSAIKSALAVLSNLSGHVTWEEYELIEKKISEKLGKSFANAVQKPVVEIQSAAWMHGAKKVLTPAKIDFMWSLPDIKSLKILEENTLFWVGDFYGEHVQTDVRKTLNAYFTGGYQRKEVIWDLKLTLGEVLSSPENFRGTVEQYWDLLADHTSTKIREIGRVSGYETAGIQKVKFRAQMDSRTTEICRIMNGRIIEVTAMRRQVEKYFQACGTKNKDKIKASWPWVSNKKAEQWADKSTKLLGKRGITLPPLHANCRSITVAYFD